MTTPYHFKSGTSALLISIPHLGQEIPEDQLQTMTPAARTLVDTDWHLDQLYDFAHELGASVLSARYSRYVVDLNRPPDDQSLYPGQTKTGLCPTLTFRAEPLYLGADPDTPEIARRVETYWKPYHAKLAAEINRLKTLHANVLLWEAHSIASVLPRLFDGRLADLNLGTASGKSAAGEVIDAVEKSLEGTEYTWVINGRFTGGYITRQFGDPARGIHAIQLEMCQSTYMEETFPFGYRDDLAEGVKPVIRAMVMAALGQVTSRKHSVFPAR